MSRLHPRRLRLEARRLRRKWVGRLLRRDQQVITLDPVGDHRGDVLVSYVLDGVRAALRGREEHAHTHYWESWCVARSFAEAGFRVDVVHWQNRHFVPVRAYRAVVDVRSNLERWVEHLPADCVKIFHGETAHWRFHRTAQARRYDRLEERRGARLDPVRPAEPNRGIETADVGFILGNDFDLGTYAFAGTPLEAMTVSSTSTYPNLERDEDSRRRFLWFGSNDLVHKGLDLVLEAVAERPHLELVVCGPIHREPAFERLYSRELHGLPNVRTVGWVDTDSEEFLDIAASCSALVFPSCSEANCGSVVHCMHAGLVPIVTRECGVDLPAPVGGPLPDDDIGTIGDAMELHAERSLDDQRGLADATLRLARRCHTRERFAARYATLVAQVLGDTPWPDPGPGTAP